MDLREKLILWIQDSVGGCARHWAEVIADGLIENGVTVQEWISVTERLPEHHSDVLVLDACGCDVAWLMDDGEWSTTLISDYPVTHWMPLPEPPKGD